MKQYCVLRPVAALALALGLVLMTSAAQAITFTIGASDSGWHSGAGNHTISNQNYSAGWSNEEFRNFFVFDLSGLPITETILSATLRAYNPNVCEPDCSFTGGYDSPDATETYELREVLATSATVTAPSVANPTVFNDLGDGPVFGSVVTSLADNGQNIQVTLNAAGIAQLQTFAGVGDVVLGGLITTLTSASGTEEFVWGHTDPPGLGPYTRQLEVVMTPEPATGFMVGLGLLTLSAARARRSNGGR